MKSVRLINDETEPVGVATNEETQAQGDWQNVLHEYGRKRTKNCSMCVVVVKTNEGLNTDCTIKGKADDE